MDRGGAWTKHLDRRDSAGVEVGIAAPVRMELRHIDQPSTATPLLVLTAVFIIPGRATLHATAAQLAALDLERYEHRVLVGPDPDVLLRGYVTLLDNVGGG